MYASSRARRVAQLGATPGPATPGDEVTVGGDVSVAADRILIRADDTGTVWTVSDVAGTGWLGLAPPYGPITRGAVRGLASGPYLIGRVSAASKYSAGERGTTIIGNAAALAQQAQAAADAPLSPALLETIIQQIAVQRMQSPVNVKYWDQFVAGVEAAYAAGRISAADRAFALTMKDDPIAAQKNAIWLPPGGGDVPLVFQGGAITDTGQIHPDALTPEAQARTREILEYTAQMRGTTYEEEAARLADKLRGANPGETFAGVEKFADAIQSGTDARLTVAEQYGAGGEAYADYLAGGDGIADGADAGPGLRVAGMSVSPLALAGLAGLGLFFVTRKPSRTSSTRRSSRR